MFDVEAIARYVTAFRQQGRDPHDLIYEYPLHTWETCPDPKLGVGSYLKAAASLTRLYLNNGRGMRR